MLPLSLHMLPSLTKLIIRCKIPKVWKAPNESNCDLVGSVNLLIHFQKIMINTP